MGDPRKTKAQLIDELTALRQRVAELEMAEAQRQRAEEKVERQNRRLQILRAIDVAILAADSVDNIVHAALDRARDLIGCRRAAMALIDWGTNEVVVFNVRTAGETSVSPGTRLPLMVYQDRFASLSTNQPVVLNDLTELQDLPPLFQTLRAEGLRSTCVLPLFSQGSQIGAFNLSADIPGFFDEEKVELGREVANQAAMAITRHRLVEALRASEEQYRALFQNSLDAIMLTSPDGSIQAANPAACKMLGRTEAEICALGRSGLADLTDLRVAVLLAERARTGQALGEVTMLRNDGSPFPVEMSSALFRDQQGHLRSSMIIRDITARQQAEQDLRESERLFSTIFRDSPIALSLVGVPDGKNLEVNEAWCTLTGYSREEAVGYDTAELKIFDPEERTRLITEFSTQGRSRLVESEITTKRGAKRNVLITSELITIRENLRIIASVIDITERRQAEEKLRQSEELFSRAFHVSPAAHTITRVGDGQFIDVNETFLRTFEFSREETIGHTSTELNMLSLEERAKLIQAQREAGGLRNAELQARSKSGRLIQLLFSSAPIDVEGEAGLISTLIDITERRQAEARILRLNRLYATLSQINQTIVRARDRDTLFREICRVAIEFGQFRMVWIGWIDEAEQRIKPIVFAGEEQGYLTEVTVKFRPQDSGRGPAGLAALEGHSVIFSHIASDPRTEPWRQPALQRGYGSSAAVPIRQNNEVVGTLTVYASEPDGFDTDDERLLDEIGLDISFALDMLEQDAQRRRAEDALQSLNLELEQRVVRRTAELAAANERLTELDRLKSKFVSTVTHELRTPVTSLGLLVDLLEHGQPAKREQYLVRLREQMTRLQTLINDILDLSRLERDAIEADWATVDINPMVEHVVAMQRVAAETAGLQLSSEVPAHPVLVRARPEHLLRAITNLISNAVKYTPTGAVNVIAYTEADRMCVQIKDTGLGIAPEDLLHLFERFYRGKQAAQSSIPGTGLGLSIVKEIVESHGGTVEVASELGVGSTFRLWLPTVID